ncbi:MAG: fibronectin type III domain-containing protein, partial [Bacteroidetes bacterium]
MKNGLLLLALLFPSFLPAQDPVLSFSTAEAVHLRWQWEPDVEGWHVERRIDGGVWERLTPTPLALPADPAQIRADLGPKAELLFTLLGAGPNPPPLTPSFLRNFASDPQALNFLGVMSLIHPEIARELGVLFVDRHGLEGVGLQYRVLAIRQGREQLVGLSRPHLAGAEETVPPVEELEAEPADRSVLLSWRKDASLLRSGEVVSFRVYRARRPAGPWEWVNPLGLLPVTVRADGREQHPGREEFLDRFLDNDSTYFYHVRAVNAFGLESAPGAMLSVTPQSRELPPRPRNLQAEPLGAALRLFWEAPSRDIRGFEIFRAERREGPYEKVHPPDELLLRPRNEWLDRHIREGQERHYFLRSVGKNGRRSRPSDTLSVLLPDESPPSPPKNLRAVASEGAVTLTWDPNPEPDLAGYVVERSASADHRTRLRLHTPLLRVPSFVDSLPPQSQTTYGYVVIAEDRAGNQSLPSEMVFARLPEKVPPQTPFLLQLEARGDTAFLRWTRSPDEDLAGFRVYHGFGSEGDLQLVGETDSTFFHFRL